MSVILSKRQTFMNFSGQSVHELVRYYDIQLEKILVIFDDLDLPIGDIRIRKSGGSSGHRGMRSVITLLGTDTIPRLLATPPVKVTSSLIPTLRNNPIERELID